MRFCKFKKAGKTTEPVKITELKINIIIARTRDAGI